MRRLAALSGPSVPFIINLEIIAAHNSGRTRRDPDGDAHPVPCYMQEYQAKV